MEIGEPPGAAEPVKATEPVRAGEPPRAIEAPDAGRAVQDAEADTAAEVREALKPRRFTTGQAMIWIVLLVFLMCGAFLLIVVLHARYYTPRLTRREFHTEVPRPRQPERSPHWNPRIDPDRPLDDADFPV
ncbi:MAG: hypothetical protein WD278_18370 [Pirellulales bacterium]